MVFDDLPCFTLYFNFLPHFRWSLMFCHVLHRMFNDLPFSLFYQFTNFFISENQCEGPDYPYANFVVILIGPNLVVPGWTEPGHYLEPSCS
jgi:hypothetical protein